MERREMVMRIDFMDWSGVGSVFSCFGGGCFGI